ncbi:UDP-N-acetylmuramoyl-tripeptide--D-alanyl-D-alanine ligase [Undibacterium arcticum]|uniref:UDP-N-acetylmuramoyl-tripeptide--D-alanyl-D-alanine ligase n=1 Tax=Undibacterium arcticum TaxID=1762892 RepID=A0ABV7F375_9BURK
MRATLMELQGALPNAMTVNATIVNHSAVHAQCDGISTDSRNVAAGNLFFALRGEHFDAHDFLPQVAAQGAAAVVVDRLPQGLNIPALVVPDTRIALGQVARFWRNKFALPLIGVTGSNGKTTVKEMIASILAAAFGADGYLATRGNLNNEIGVPLTLARLTAAHQAAVVELGMNHPGEIAMLTAIAQPTIGLVNNAQREHQEFMASVDAVAQENGAVISGLPGNGIAVFPADDQYSPLWRGYARSSGQRRIVTFGLSDDADVRCSFQGSEFGNEMQVFIGANTFAVKLAAPGVHNVRNALAAVACTFASGVAFGAIVHGLESFAPVSGRLQRKTALNGAKVIDDTYNANPDSVRAAIDVLAQADGVGVLVLGDMGEVGNEGRQFHEEIGAYAHARGIDLLFTLGQLAQHSATAFGTQAKHYDDLGALQQALDAVTNKDTTVLVKGSRFMKMERLVQHLINEPTREAH